MGEKQISTGEVAKVSGRTEGGRRFYTENDMIKLEHIIFYRGLGFSLNQFLGNSFDCQQGCGG